METVYIGAWELRLAIAKNAILCITPFSKGYSWGSYREYLKK